MSEGASGVSNQKSRCADYAKLFLPEGSQQESIHNILLNASFSPHSDSPVREASIGYFDSPFGYSFKYEDGDKPPRLRLTTEPGNLSTPISVQIDDSIQAVNEIIDLLHWNQTADAVSQVLSLIFPPDAEAVDYWRGGIWLGMDSDNSLLKVYMNLRHQDSLFRWQRLILLFKEFGTADSMHSLEEIFNLTQADGIPVGLCIGFNGEGLQGIRLYISCGPQAESVSRACCRRWFPHQEGPLTRFFKSFVEVHGALREQSCALGFDFAIAEDGTLSPKPLRLKSELSCCHLTAEQQKRIPALVNRMLEEQSLSPDLFQADEARILSIFGALFYQYLSIGVTEKHRHVSVYLEAYGESVPSHPIVIPSSFLTQAADARSKAVNFLLSFRRKNGHWFDFDMKGPYAPGSSDLWVEAYVAFCLCKEKEALKSCMEAGQRLLSLQNSDGGWGYCTGYPSDADSTARTILLLKQLEIPIPEQAYQALIRFQRSDYGFSTYCGDKLGGWSTASHPDVTMSAICALSGYLSPTCNLMRKAKSYFDQQLQSGFPPSYWWCYAHYSGVEAVKCGQAMNWPIYLRAKDIPTIAPDDKKALHLALYLELLDLLDSSDTAALQRLLSLQRADGSFEPSPILRVTQRKFSQPWETTEHTGNLETDIQGVFGTATAVRLLANFHL